MEELTGYDDIVSELDLRTFTSLDRVVNFSWLFIWTLCATREITVFVLLQQYMK